MRKLSACGAVMALGVAVGFPTGAWARQAAPPVPAEPTAGGVYEPAYFERFAPRTALDMLEQVPGFQIEGGNQQGDAARGLGQANQNVLINGERLSSKSEGLRDQLKRIPASKVRRIEIVDGTSLDVPGLSGQVANVTVDLDGLTGSFEWKSRIRTTAVDPEWYGGEVSLAGRRGDLTFTLALKNNNERGGSEGPGVLRDGLGALIRTEDIVQVTSFDKPTVSANLGYDFGSGVTATLNLSYNRGYFRRRDNRDISGPALDPFLRSIFTRENGYEYEVSGDVTVPVGAGQLKLIGVERFDNEDFSQTLVDDFAPPGLDSTGSRFTRHDRSGERIGRAEYSFSLFGADWQLAGEAAFNRLARVSGLFELDPTGAFVAQTFPEGTGGVKEARYDLSASFSKALTPRLALQFTGGYEFSTISQTGSAANQRSFARPKGSASLAWSAGSGLDLTATVERKVGQLDFGDFLARVFLDNDNANGGNNELVPQQSWETRFDITKTLGPWGSTSVALVREWIEDYIDIVPIGAGGEARGNIDRARISTLLWNSTFKLDPLGWRGAQITAEIGLEDTTLRDPLTGERRSASEGSDRDAEIELRQDIPGSDIAWGSRLRYERSRRYVRTSEIGRVEEGPAFLSMYVEHKDLLGLKARVTVGNLLGGRDTFERTVWDGYRDTAPILFTEQRDRRIGPIFRFDISGNF
jgi:hypothetical protein